MKTGRIIIGIACIIVIILLYAMFIKTPFDANMLQSTIADAVPTTSTMTPTEPWFLQYDRYAREAGVDISAATNPNTLPHLNTKQLQDESAYSLMMQNAAIRRRLMPDLYPAEDTTGAIAEDQSPVNPSDTNEGAVVEQTTYDHDNSSIIGAGGTKEIGTSIMEIGKSITELPGEMSGNLGYAGYNISSDYNLLPASLYNNMWDYKQSSSAPSSNYDTSTGTESNILDKMSRAILQKDFAGVSNIFAPNFIFLGKKDDYSIGFDENWQYP